MLDLEDWDKISNIPWLELLRLLTDVETLHVSIELGRGVAVALKGVTTETCAGVLPALDSLYLEGQPVRLLRKLLGVLRDSGRPFTVDDDLNESDEDEDFDTEESE